MFARLTPTQSDYIIEFTILIFHLPQIVPIQHHIPLRLPVEPLNIIPSSSSPSFAGLSCPNTPPTLGDHFTSATRACDSVPSSLTLIVLDSMSYFVADEHDFKAINTIRTLASEFVLSVYRPHSAVLTCHPR